MIFWGQELLHFLQKISLTLARMAAHGLVVNNGGWPVTDAPTPYPPPQLVITYSGGRYHVDVAGEEGQDVVAPAHLLALVDKWMQENEE